jgi:hypothetical protein
MENQSTLKWLIPLIGMLALFVAAAGLFYQTPGQLYPYRFLQLKFLKRARRGWMQWSIPRPISILAVTLDRSS